MRGKGGQCRQHTAYLWCIEFHKGIAFGHLLLIIALGHVETISSYISHNNCQAYRQALTFLRTPAI